MRKDKQKGFTLIELMIAMAVMAFGILGFTFLNSRALSNRTFSRDLNRSTVTAERLAENIMYLNYDDPLLDDANSEAPAVATSYPLDTATGGDTGTIADMDYIVTTSADGFKWFTVEQENRRCHLRWRVITGRDGVAGSPNDNIKLILIFAAFDKKDPKTGDITFGGYNRDPAKIVPTIVTFKTE